MESGKVYLISCGASNAPISFEVITREEAVNRGILTPEGLVVGKLVEWPDPCQRHIKRPNQRNRGANPAQA